MSISRQPPTISFPVELESEPEVNNDIENEKPKPVVQPKLNPVVPPKPKSVGQPTLVNFKPSTQGQKITIQLKQVQKQITKTVVKEYREKNKDAVQNFRSKIPKLEEAK